MSEDEAFHLPQVPDMLIADSGHGQKVTFRIPVVWPRLVSSTPHLVPQPVAFDLSEIPNIKTSGKDTNNKAEGRTNVGTRSGLTPSHQKIKRMRQDASITMYSLQLVAEEFKKSTNWRFKAKSKYSANAMLLFNYWLKDVEMCIREQKLTNLESVQLIKDYQNRKCERYSTVFTLISILPGIMRNL